MEEEGDRWSAWYTTQGMRQEIANVACALNIDPPIYTAALLLPWHDSSNSRILWPVLLLIFLTTRLPLPWRDSSDRKLVWHVFLPIFLSRPRVCPPRDGKFDQGPTARSEVIEGAFGGPARCPAQHPQKRMWVSKWRQIETSTVESIMAFYRTSIIVMRDKGGVPQSASTFE